MYFLVVDTNPIRRRFFIHYLKDQGHDAHAISDTNVAIPCLAARQYDGILLRLRMPKICAADLIKIIRGAYPNLPILTFEEPGFEEDIEEARSAGANDHVTMNPEIKLSEIYSALMRIVPQPAATQP